MKVRILYIVLLSLSLGLAMPPAKAQHTRIFKESFEKLAPNRSVSGISNSALNLSANADDRKPIHFQVDKSQWKESFTLTGWLWAAEDFEDYQVFSLQLNHADSSKTIWNINKQANHAWSWSVSSNKSTLDYKPGFKRQQVTKFWTMLAMSYNASREEVSLYYNDTQVAIYSLEGMLKKRAILSVDLMVGGEIKGELGEWESFNGKVDEVAIYNQPLTADEIKGIYQSLVKPGKAEVAVTDVDKLKVMTFNIWHGGNETGKGIGYERVAHLIEQSGADIIAMQETYGSGAKIADELGFYFYLRSSNISIMSRYPIVNTLDAAHPFNNGNVLIQVGQQQVAFASVWLNYPIDYWEKIDKGERIDIENWKQLQNKNKATMVSVIEKLKPQLQQTEQIPLFICGDFNTGSHRDWVASVKDLNAGYIMPFPTSIYLEGLGFRDTFREVYPDPKQNRGITWTPQNPDTHQDRIDYIYLINKKTKVIDAKVINEGNVKFPSDHGAVITTVLLPKKQMNH